jgi:beta-glucanase (GH16 family)
MERHKVGTRSTFRCLRVSAAILYFSSSLGLSIAGLPERAQAADPQPPTSVPLPTGATAWNLILNDDFIGTAYDTATWNPYADWGGVGSFNAGRENYYPSQIQVSNGVCHLVAQPNPGATTFANSYKSGELISARANTNPATPYKFSFLYGYVEARLKIVNITGFFGAFWMLPDKTDYNYEWEIDILEVLGCDHRTMYQTYHYAPGLPAGQARNTSWTPNQGSGNNGNAPVLDYSTAYHTIGVDWEPDHLTFYIDSIASGTFPTRGTNNSNIARTAGYILIQQMVDNSWLRAAACAVHDTTSATDTFDIDYVRVWQGTSQSGVGDGGRSVAQGNAGIQVVANPMHGQTTFMVTGEGQGRIAVVTVYSDQGRLIRRLAGTNPVWDGANEQGEKVRPGPYFYSVDCAGMTHTGKILCVR